mgnify:CR=1 FL=1
MPRFRARAGGRVPVPTTPVLNRIVVTAPDNMIVGVPAQATFDALMTGSVPLGTTDTPVPGVTVTWSSSDTNVATIDADTGIITPQNAGTCLIRATAQGITGEDSATVVATPTLSTLTIVPDPASVTVNLTLQLSATATWTDGSTNVPTLTWSKLSGDGSIDSVTGIYTAPAAAGSATIQVANGLITDTVVVTINAAPAVLVSLTVVPDAPTLEVTQQQQFAATSTWSDGSTANPAPLQWSIDSGGGSINSAGLYTAGASAGSVVVRVTFGSVTDTTTITVTTPPPPPLVLNSLTLSPGSVTLQTGQQQQFVTTAAWSDGSTVLPPDLTYSVVSGLGSITSGGLYTAGPTTGSATVKVESAANSVSDTSPVTINAAGSAVPFHTFNPADYATTAAMIAAMNGSGPQSQSIAGLASVYDASTIDQSHFLENDGLFGKRLAMLQLGIDKHCPANGGIPYPADGVTTLCTRNLSGSGPMARLTWTFSSGGVPCYLNPFWHDAFVMFPDETDVPYGNSVGYVGWQPWGQPTASAAIKLFAGLYQGGNRLFRSVIVNGSMRPDFHDGDVAETADSSKWTRTVLWQYPASFPTGPQIDSIPYPGVKAANAPKNGWWNYRFLYHRVSADEMRFAIWLRNSHYKDGTPISLATNPWRGQLVRFVRTTGVATLRLGISSQRMVESMNSTPIATQFIRSGKHDFFGGVNGGSAHPDPLGLYAYMGLTPP